MNGTVVRTTTKVEEYLTSKYVSGICVSNLAAQFCTTLKNKVTIKRADVAKGAKLHNFEGLEQITLIYIILREKLILFINKSVFEQPCEMD